MTARTKSSSGHPTDITLSVVMATYNGLKHLPEQLLSIESQTLRPDELLIIDDASTDGSWAWLLEWSQSRPWVKVTRHHQNLGINHTFWELLQMSRGDWTLISDQDDVWHPEKIETMCSGLAAGTQLLFSDGTIVDEHLQTLAVSELQLHGWDPHKNHHPAYFIARNHASGHNMMVHRALVQCTPKPPAGRAMMYDQWLALSARLRGSLQCLPQALVQHRLHSNNAFNNRRIRPSASPAISRRDRKLAGFRQRLDAFASLKGFEGLDPDFDRLAQDLQSRSQALQAKCFSAGFFMFLMARRRDLFGDQKWSRTLRMCLKWSLGPAMWRWM